MMFLFPLNNFESQQAEAFFLSYEFKYEDVVQWDVDRTRQVGSKLLVDHVKNLCSFWRYAFRLMVFSPGKVFDSFDEVVVLRWFAFVKDPTVRCAGFVRHAFPITVQLLMWQVGFGIVCRVFDTPVHCAVATATLGALYECLAVAENSRDVRAPLSIHVQTALQQEVMGLYRGLADYLTCCSVALQRCSQLVVNTAAVRAWPTWQLLNRAVREATGILGFGSSAADQVRLLPSADYFMQKATATSELTFSLQDGRWPDPGRGSKYCTQFLESVRARDFVENVTRVVTEIEGCLNGAAFRAAAMRGLSEDVVKQGLMLDKDKCKGMLRKSFKTLIAVWEKAEPGGRAPKCVQIETMIEDVAFPMPVFREVDRPALSLDQLRRVFL